MQHLLGAYGVLLNPSFDIPLHMKVLRVDKILIGGQDEEPLSTESR